MTLTSALPLVIADPPVDNSRETSLLILLRVPAYGKPEQDMKTAESVLHDVQVSSHSQVAGHLVVNGKLLHIKSFKD